MQYAASIVVLVIAVGAVVVGIQLFQQDPEPQQRVSLVQQAGSDSTAELRIAGPVVARERHQIIEIEVSQDSRSVAVLEGYEGESNVIRSRSYGNDQAAFRNFIAALDTANFNVAKESEVERLGACPQGQRYTYTLTDGGTPAVDLWGTSCGEEQGTFAGNAKLVQELFIEQIPDYEDVTEEVDF